MKSLEELIMKSFNDYLHNNNNNKNSKILHLLHDSDQVIKTHDSPPCQEDGSSVHGDGIDVNEEKKSSSNSMPTSSSDNNKNNMIMSLRPPPGFLPVNTTTSNNAGVNLCEILPKWDNEKQNSSSNITPSSSPTVAAAAPVSTSSTTSTNKTSGSCSLPTIDEECELDTITIDVTSLHLLIEDGADNNKKKQDEQKCVALLPDAPRFLTAAFFHDSFVRFDDEDVLVPTGAPTFLTAAFFHDCFVRFDNLNVVESCQQLRSFVQTQEVPALAALSRNESACSSVLAAVETPPSSSCLGTTIRLCGKDSITTSTTKMETSISSTEELSPFNTFGGSPYVTAATLLGFSSYSSQNIKKQSVSTPVSAIPSPAGDDTNVSTRTTTTWPSPKSRSSFGAVEPAPTPFGTSTPTSSVPCWPIAPVASRASPFTKEATPFGTSTPFPSSSSSSSCSDDPTLSSNYFRSFVYTGNPKGKLGESHGNNNKKKNKPPCKFLAMGCCKYGDTCKFLHGPPA